MGRLLKLDLDADDGDLVRALDLDRVAALTLDERFERLFEMQQFAL